jgi:hypothetical protein
VGEVDGIAKLPSNSSHSQKYISQRRGLDRRLEMLKWFSNSHHWNMTALRLGYRDDEREEHAYVCEK